MGRRKDEPSILDRREFLRRLGYASPILLPAPFRAYSPFPSAVAPSSPAFADFRFKPSYPNPSPVDEMLRLVAAGSDAYVSEKYAAELQQRLQELGQALRLEQVSEAQLASFLYDPFRGRGPRGFVEQQVRSAAGVELRRRGFGNSRDHDALTGRDGFLRDLTVYFRSLGSISVSEFEILSLISTEPDSVSAEIRYTLAGSHANGVREQRIGRWNTKWTKASSHWRIAEWLFTEETSAKTTNPPFADATSQAFAGVESYKGQLSLGLDHWRTVLDGASGIDVYGNNGIAAGDFDGDGRDDVYVCQPSGLPNRLYRNRGDGTSKM